MTNAEQHQIELESREKALDNMIETVRTAVVKSGWNSRVAAVAGANGNTFIVVDLDGDHFKVTIEEI